MPLPTAARVPDYPTVAEFADRYVEEHVAANCKPETGSAPTIEGLLSVGDVDAVAREAAERVANRIAANVL